VKVFAFQLAYFVLILLAVAGCSQSLGAPDDRPPPSAENVPIYPGAQLTTSHTTSTGRGPVKSISLTTNDSPELVTAFYDDILVKDNWESRPGASMPGESYFGWHGSSRQPAYELTIRTRRLDTHQTSVELELLTELPY
jgi:hypothetical protein